MNEPFLTYRFQGMKFEFGPEDKITIVNERNLPFYESYELIITESEYIPFTLQVKEKGMKDES